MKVLIIRSSHKYSNSKKAKSIYTEINQYKQLSYSLENHRYNSNVPLRKSLSWNKETLSASKLTSWRST